MLQWGGLTEKRSNGALLQRVVKITPQGRYPEIFFFFMFFLHNPVKTWIPLIPRSPFAEFRQDGMKV